MIVKTELFVAVIVTEAADDVLLFLICVRFYCLIFCVCLMLYLLRFLWSASFLYVCSRSCTLLVFVMTFTCEHLLSFRHTMRNAAPANVAILCGRRSFACICFRSSLL